MNPFFPPTAEAAPRPTTSPGDPGRLGRHPMAAGPGYGPDFVPPGPAPGPHPVRSAAPSGPAYHGDRGPAATLGPVPTDPRITIAPDAITRQEPRAATPAEGADPEWTAGSLYQVLLAEERGENRDVWLFLSAGVTAFPEMVGPFPVGVMRRAFGQMDKDQPPFIAVQVAGRLQIICVGPPIFVPGNPINLMRRAFACIADGCKAANPDTGLWLGAMTKKMHSYLAPAAPGGQVYAAPGKEPASQMVGVPHPGDEDDGDDDSEVDSDVEATADDAVATQHAPQTAGGPGLPTECLQTASAGDILRAMAGFPDTAHVHLLHEPGTDRAQGQCVQTVGHLRTQIGAYPDGRPVYFPSPTPGYGHAVALEGWAPTDYVDRYLDNAALKRQVNTFWLLARPSILPA